ncbi:hypothetical protein FJB45_002240 [Enterococcus faecium]|nr:hypothetical protein [Enterococcus faecium]
MTNNTFLVFGYISKSQLVCVCDPTVKVNDLNSISFLLEDMEYVFNVSSCIFEQFANHMMCCLTLDGIDPKLNIYFKSVMIAKRNQKRHMEIVSSELNNSDQVPVIVINDAESVYFVSDAFLEFDHVRLLNTMREQFSMLSVEKETCLKTYSLTKLSLKSIYTSIEFPGSYLIDPITLSNTDRHVLMLGKRSFINSAYLSLPNRRGILDVSLEEGLKLTIGSRASINQRKSKKIAKVLKIKRKNEDYHLDIKIPREYKEAENFKLILQKRKSFDESVIVKADFIKGRKARFHFDSLSINWTHYYWDLYLQCTHHDEQIFCRIKVYSVLLYFGLQYFHLPYRINMDENILYPYVTLDDSLSMNFRPKTKYEGAKTKVIELLAFFLGSVYKTFKKKDIWILFEKYSSTAQDNGYAFFKYIENNDEIKKYFILDANSPKFAALSKKHKSIVPFMGLRHLIVLVASDLVISSESKGHGYAWRVQVGPIKKVLDKKKYVFLQHGVIGLKKLDDTFSVTRPGYANLFIASAEWEKEIIMNELGYEDNQVAVTGLARWDEIKRVPRKSILIVPTWRFTLEDISKEEFTKSAFFSNYQKLMNDSDLLHYAKSNQLEIVFFLHPKINQYYQLFSSKNDIVKFGVLGKDDLGSEISKAKCLITDYSSVYWEALYQDIPTVFFQFDFVEYIENQGSYLNLRSVKGIHCYTIEDLIDSLVQEEFLNENILDNNNETFPFKDKHNSFRILNAIQSTNGAYFRKKRLGFIRRTSQKSISGFKKYLKKISKSV